MNLKASAELSGLDLRDKRLETRAIEIIKCLGEKPDATFPKAFDQAGLEAFYRFIENPYVNHEALLKPHIASTIERAASDEDVLIVHDTTEFVFNGERYGLTHHNGRYDSTSFFGHFSLAVSRESRRPLGILEMATWSRSESTPTPSSKRREGVSRKNIKALPSEADRWFEGIRSTGKSIGNRAIHVCDSEADNYTLFAQMTLNGNRFVIRACQNRKIKDCKDKLVEVLQKQPLLTKRTVDISRRKGGSSKRRHLMRAEREAELEIRLCEVKLQRPNTCSTDLPPYLKVNVIYVLEVNAPADCQPVEWVLLTTEPISTVEETLRIIDVYRARWIIEEYFKALKTGCTYESRQLESYETLLNCLALFVPIAWLMLLLRNETRSNGDDPAESVLPVNLLIVLRKRLGKELLSIKDALLGIAQLGGHIKNNGPPGWLILWRGFQELILLTEGYLLAKKHPLRVKQKM
jgi:hypothetical protein